VTTSGLPRVGPARTSKHLGAAVEDAIAALTTINDGCEEFDEATNVVYESLLYDHSVYFMGAGKSTLVSHKLAASFRSFNLRSFSLHAADMTHGDMGAVEFGDTIVAISHSGTTEDVVTALSALDTKLGSNYRLLIITSSREAVEALEPDAILTYQAAELLGYAPTSSCVAQLVIGDALLAAVCDRLGMDIESLALNHPGGSLGRLLTSDA
jgi:arabinose-5-phosphate isomerase